MILTMLPFTIPTTSAAEERAHLDRLHAERRTAVLAGDAGLRDELDDEIAGATSAFVGLAVTEIATLRAEIAGRPQG